MTYKPLEPLVWVAMCHGFDIRREYEREREREPEPEAADDEPAFANEEASVETEVLTDGGDEDAD